MITGTGVAYLKAPRRREIRMFGKFTIQPSTVERIVRAGRVEQPYIEVRNGSINTKKFPVTVTYIVAMLPGWHCVLNGPIAISVNEDRIRFEGPSCEEFEQ